MYPRSPMVLLLIAWVVGSTAAMGHGAALACDTPAEASPKSNTKTKR